MKTRIASSIALAAALLLGATGCGLVAPQATTDPYAPSDGIEASLSSLDVRNMMLIVAEDGEHFNVVFTGVNSGNSPVQLRINFVDRSGSAVASSDFLVEPGIQPFGDPEGDNEVGVVAIPGLAAGDTVTAYFEVAGSEDVERQVPVLDGALAEYRPYVLPRSFTAPPVEEDEDLVEMDSEGAAAALVEEETE